MAEFKIDRLRFTWKGIWSSATTYPKDSIVSENGRSYVCLIAHTSTSNFNNDLNHTAEDGSPVPYWTLMLDGHTWRGPWTPVTSYTVGNIVIYGGNAYICKEGHSSASTFDPYYWDVYGVFTTWQHVWVQNHGYGVGDIVRYGGKVYRCNTAHTSAPTTILGLEYDILNWDILVDNIAFRGDYNPAAVRYKIGDVVKLGPELYICNTGHLSADPFSESNWDLWMPGVEFGGTWDPAITYQAGDIVMYGGYSYISNIVNNVGNTPSTDAVSWSLFTQGYELQSDWTSITSYKIGDVVRLSGQLFVAIADSLNQRPTAVEIATTYQASGSSGTQINLGSSSGIVPGMFITGSGFNRAQIVRTVGTNQVTINEIPDSPLVDGQAIVFTGINYTYWQMLVPGYTWKFKWTNNTVYHVGDIAMWKNASYKCVKYHTSTSLNRPDADDDNVYWTLFLQNDIYNALNESGEMVSFLNGESVAIPIGPESYILKSVDNFPTWSSIFITPNVFYVATNGIDSPERGTTWDIPWRTIKYACERVQAGFYNQSAKYLLDANKEFIVTEAFEWMTYQRANNNAPFSISQPAQNEYKTKRDSRYTLDALIYDLSRGGTSQTVGNTLTYFDLISGNKFTTTGVAAGITQFTAVINYLFTVAQNVLSNTPPTANYQELNRTWNTSTSYSIGDVVFYLGDWYSSLANGNNSNAPDVSPGFWSITSTPEDIIEQVIDLGYTSESSAITKTTSLQNIIVTAFTTGLVSSIPRANDNVTVTIMVKSGTYEENIPIIVPANTSIVGDELRGVTVRPSNSVNTLATRTIGGGVNNIYVGSTNNMEEGTRVQFVSLNPVSSASGITYINTVFGNLVSGRNYYVIGSSITPTSFRVRVFGESLATVALGVAGSGYSQGLAASVSAPETEGGYTATVNPVVDLNTGSILSYTITSPGSGYTSPPTVTLELPDDATANYLQAGATADEIVVDTIINEIYYGMEVSGTGITSNQIVINIQENTPQFAQTTITLSAAVDSTPSGTLTFSDPGSGGAPGVTTISNQDIPVNVTTENGFMYVYGGGALGDMFRLRNGTTMRNMTFSGMLGTLSSENSYGTRRPTGGSCTALDPGTGPDDTSAWIIRKSPYIQNCTNFGAGAVGLKVDSTIHNGGQHSVVCNDFTQVLSDGVGVWVYGGDALVEAVSVFAYFCYAGYLSENGGRSRATNGNSSYGEYGVLSEGYDPNEVPTTGSVDNRAQQATAAAVSSFGANAQILKVQYTNSGNAYNIPVTNLLKYTNNFLGANWVNDGNVLLSQSSISPFGISEAWTLTANTSITDSSYLYQNITIPASGKVYTNIAGTNLSGSGLNATFNITVTPGGYVVTVNNSGTGYVQFNEILITGDTFGGIAGMNDLTITVASIQAPSSILTVTTTGNVPSGTTQYYTLSLYAKQGTATSFDIYAIYSGSSTVMSAITYNWATGIVAGSSQDGGGAIPLLVKATPTNSNGWYRFAFSVYDVTGLNTNLQFRIYPRGRSGVSGYNTFYGTQLEVGLWPITNYYLENTTTNRYEAYANVKVTGAGSGAIAIGNEIRSKSIYQTIISAGGSGFITANNNAQGGNSGTGYLTLAQSDVATANTYVGMRLLVTSGLGAGQYGYIASFNPVNKNAYVLKESFTPVLITNTSSSTNQFTIDPSSDVNTLYTDQPVQFIPKFFTTTVTAISQNQITATETIGGLTNTITVSSTAQLAVNMPISFTGTTFGQITAGYTYYVATIVDSTHIQISTTFGGVIWTLVNATGTMNLNYPANTGYLTGSTTNMLPNFAIQFTGTTIGNSITIGTYYYVNDVIDANTFTISTSAISIAITNTTTGTNLITLSGTPDTTSLIALNPIIFTGTGFGNIVANQKYYISSKPSSTQFTISSTLIKTTATATQTGSNLITVTSTTGFVLNNPVIFTGTTFGGLVAEQVYYVSVINNSTSFTVSLTPGGAAVSLSTATGNIICRTTGSNVTLSTASGSMVGNTTSTKLLLDGGTGSMIGTFSTPLFGGINAGTTYYIRTITTGATNYFTIASSQGGGSNVTLTSGLGFMQVAQVGWDNINPGTPDTALFDSTSTYFIEPRLTFSEPSFNQSTSGSLGGAVGTVFNSLNYGNGNFYVTTTLGNSIYKSSTGTSFASLTLPTTAPWTDLAYGSGFLVLISFSGSGAGSKILYSNSDGMSWLTSSLPSTSGWTNVEYGNGTFVAISSGAAYYDLATTNIVGTGTGCKVTVRRFGTTYKAVVTTGGSGYANGDSFKILGTSLGGATTANDATFTVTNVLAGAVTAVTVSGTAVAGSGAQPAYSTNFGETWNSGSGISQLAWSSLTYGLGKFVAVANGSRNVATSTDGITWTVTTNALPTSTTWSQVVFGNNKFVAVSSTSAKPAYSLDGITWYESPYTITATSLSYGQGVFVALNDISAIAYTSEDAILWIQKSITTTASGMLSTFGVPGSNQGLFVTLSSTGSIGQVFAGCRAQGRPSVYNGEISSITLWEPGSSYSGNPTVVYTDPNNSSDATLVTRIGDGSLGGPTFISRGANYSTTSTAITIRGSGYADNYQIGTTLYAKNVTKLPTPGSNLQFIGANTQIYKVTSSTALYGTTAPTITAQLTISPALSVSTTPEHLAGFTVREKYSQVRLTNHDFLNIGYGNTYQSNYPGFPIDTNLNQSNYTVESNNGRVFYSSTDQDGNFQVGGLFGVEQATGIVTLSASQFGLTGLSQLKLGGVSVGNNQVIITAFSTDTSFLANSNSIIPTQRAIKAYLAGRLSQGGANTFTGQLTAGTVVVGGPDKITSTIAEGQAGWQVRMLSKVNMQGQFAGVDGDLPAMQFFIRNGTSKGFNGRNFQ